MTCAMDMGTWLAYVHLNRDLKKGETPRGSFRARQNIPGVWPASGDFAISPDHEFVLTAEQFTDMCAVQLSHTLRGSQKYEEIARWAVDGERSPAFRAMAEHLGGAALKAYEHALVAVKEQWAEAEAAQAQAEAKL